MKACRIACFLLLGATALAVQAPPGLRGIVVRVGDDAVVANATVELRKVESVDAAFETKTAGDGTFQFVGVPGGPYQVHVLRDGYVPMVYGQRYPGGPEEVVQISASGPPSSLRISLTPDGVISGRITDQLGRPMPNVNVSAGKLSYEGGRRSIRGVESRLTDDLGAYRLFSLSPGQYYVTGTPPDSGGLAAITYPSAVIPTDGIAVDLTAGATVPNIDIRLGLPTLARTIRATAVDVRTGQPVVPTFWNFMGVQVNSGFAGGIFELARATPGRYTLVAAAGEATGRVSFEVADRDLELIVPVGEKFDIAGHVSVEGETGPESLASVRVNLDADSVLRGPTTRLPARPSADGSFTLNDVQPGKFRVSVAMPGLPDSYVKSIRIGRDDGLMDWLTIDRPRGDSLDVVISLKAAVVEGRVVPAEPKQPIAGATVVLVPDGERRSHAEFFHSVMSGKDGSFRFENVPPGSYKVFGWEHVAPGSWLVPEFLRRDEERGRPIVLQEGSRETVEVPILPAR